MNLSVNKKRVLTSIPKAGISIVQLSENCGIQKTLTFDVRNLTGYLGRYVSTLAKGGALLIGVSRDIALLNYRTTRNTLNNELGVTLDANLGTNRVYAFAAWIGYRSLTQTWGSELKDGDPFIFTESVCIGKLPRFLKSPKCRTNIQPG